jgi:REP element-mobilizing transposase RayT
MRQPRLLRRHASATYHAFSRIVDRQCLIGREEKQFFHHWMRRLETFCGVRVLTYCLMSNHFHLLVRVPCKAEQPALTEDQLRAYLPLLYRGRQLAAIREEIDRAAEAANGGNTRWLAEILARYDARRFDLSSFLKDLKQRFSQWYNERNGRYGHLWEGAFRSVLVEDGEEALLATAGYIDLNPVRAGICKDPKDYRWSGYGEAVGGGGENRRCARRGLSDMLQATRFGVNRRVNWGNAGPRYRMLLYVQGEERAADARTGSPGRLGINREQVVWEMTRGGTLSLAEILRCRVRYFTEGQVLGSREFVDGVFGENHGRFGRRRRQGAQNMVDADWGSLTVLVEPRADRSA